MKINCFIPFQSVEQVADTVKCLKSSSLVHKIFLLAESGVVANVEGCECLSVGSLTATSTIKAIAAKADTPYTLIYTKSDDLVFGYFALDRMLRIAEDTNAGMVYSDHYKIKDGAKTNSPVIPYQKGALRDGFDFGSVLLYKTSALKKAVAEMTADYQFAAIYDLRLKVSQTEELVHINEYLYTEIEHDLRKTGAKQFDYVDPANRPVQIEMELACTDHLKKIGAFLEPKFQDVAFDKQDFEFEASVIIPVRNRVRTICDAVQSVLKQKTNFKFNRLL